MKTQRFATRLSCFVLALAATAARADHWLTLERESLTVGINQDLTIAVYQGAETPAWESLADSAPTIDVQYAGDEAGQEPQRLLLDEAGRSGGH